MKLSRRANTIILWIVSIGLLAGMIITFTPTLGLGGGGGTAGPVAMRVNGEPIREMQVSQTRRNPLFLSVTEGEVGADLELLLVDTLIRQEVVRQEGSRQRVSDADVRRAVEEFRVSRGVTGRANDGAYLNAIAGAGFTDETFRTYLRQQLQQERWEASLVGDVDISDAEVRAFYDGNRDGYRSEERIEARHIVTVGGEEAEAALARLRAGEDAGTVARETSVERADRDGALGAGAGETAPRPVGRPALPTAVATAAFALGGPGVTRVVESDGRFHVVVVDAYLPAAPRPFEEVASFVRDDALAAKRAGVLEGAVEGLVDGARVEFPEGSIVSYDNVPVARVGDVSIMATDLVRATYTNPQIQQALSPDTAFIISAFFKPSILAQLVDQEVVLQAVDELGVPFVGPRSLVAQSALNYVARDAVADEEAVQAYYQRNLANYTIPASARAIRLEVGTLDAAIALRSGLFQEDLPADVDTAALAERLDAEVENLGLVVPGRLEALLDVTLFGTEAFEDLPGGPWQASDILVLSAGAETLPDALDVRDEGEDAEAVESAAERYVVLVAQRSPERVRPLDEVRAQVTSLVLEEARAALRDAWVEEIRASVPVVDSLLPDPNLGSGFVFGGDEPAIPDAPTEPDETEPDAPADDAPTPDGPTPDAPADGDVDPSGDTDGEERATE